MQTKTEIRSAARTGIKSLTDRGDELARTAAEKAYDFIEHLDLESGTPLGLFLSMKGKEIETAPLIELLKASPKRYRILVPRVEDETTINFYPYDDAAPHRISEYGIWEPLAPVSEAVAPEVIVVPGLAFDRKGGRVGHGKGYYDRYFRRYEDAIRMRIAFAYEVQVFDEVPMDDFDLPMHALVTDRSVTTI